MSSFFGGAQTVAGGGSGGQPVAAREVVTATPTAGQTRTDLSTPADSRDRTFWMTPAGTLATLTITMPLDASSRLGQIVEIGTTQAITALSFTAGPTVLNADSSMVANTLIRYEKVAANTWIKT